MARVIGTLVVFGLIFGAYEIWHTEKKSEATTNVTSKISDKVVLAPKENVTTSSSALASWSSFKPELKNIGDVSQSELDGVYLRARDIIQRDEEGFFRAVQADDLARVAPEESFFTVTAWMKYSSSPERILQKLNDYAPPADPPGLDTHHPPPTLASRSENLKAYTVRKLRKLYQEGQVRFDSEGEKNLVTQLEKITSAKPSLNLSLEAFQLLSDLHQDEVIKQSLTRYSQRDRQLISEVLQLK